MKKIGRYLIVFFAFIFISVLYSCEGGSLEGGGGNDNGTTAIDNITITVADATITTANPTTGVTNITVKVTDSNGNPLKKDIKITTNLGQLKSGSSQSQEINTTTDDNGNATVEFIAEDTPGEATITVETDNTKSSTNINIIKIGTVSITADKQYMFKNDVVLLTVSVKDIYNNPASGVKVVLNSSDENSLVVGSSILTTNDNGTASIYASSKDIQTNTTVQVNAQSGDKTNSIALNILVPAKIMLTVSPTTIKSGGETATISATVTDNNGDPTPNVTVNFTSDMGTISQNSVQTNTNGVATTYLTSDNNYGDANIKATVGDLSEQTTIKIIQSTVINIPNTIELVSVESNQIYIKGSGNKETSLIQFKVVDGKGNPVENARIQFSILGGSMGGEYLVPSSGVTDSNGIVETTLKAGTKPGVVKIQAWYSDSIKSAIQSITILSGPPEGKHLSMALEKLNIIGLKRDGVDDTVTARLADLYSNPVPEGTAVHFESEFSKIQGADTTTGSSEEGVASAILYSQDPRPVNGAPVHVWSQTQTGEYGYVSFIYVSNDKMYAGTDGGGLFKTLDDGKSWSNIGKPKSYSEGYKGLWGTYINSMDVYSKDSNFIAVATEDGGVLYSEDGGYNWKNLNSRSDRYTETVNNFDILKYTPINLRERISVKTSWGGDYIGWNIAGRFFSAKDAGTYTITYDINYGMPHTPAKIVRILDSNNIFAYFVGYGVYKFDKSQLHWGSFNSGLASTNLTTMALVDSDGNGAYDDLYITISGQVYKSSVAADNFVAVGAAQSLAFNDAYVVGTDIYYATTEGVKKFDTTTNSWTDIASTGCPTNNIKHIVVDGGNIYIGTDIGAYRVDIASGNAYPLNVYKEETVAAADTNAITLTYDSDKDKTHTEIYVNGIELPSTYYNFDDEKTIRLVDGVDNITKNSVIDIYYTLKPFNQTDYTSAPQKKITALYFKDGKLYVGCNDRKLYRLDNPDVTSNTELPKINDISGVTDKINYRLYKTTQVMFTGDTRIRAHWDSDGDGYFDDNSINVPNGGSQTVYVYVSDYNGRPLVAGSTINFGCDVGTFTGQDSTLPDTEYGGYGITEYVVTISDDDSTTSEARTGSLTITVESENGNETLSIPITVN